MQTPGGDAAWNRTWPKISFAVGVLLIIANVVQFLRQLPIEPTLVAAGLGLLGLPAFKGSGKSP